MQNNESRQPVGSLRISKDVIATITSFATKEIAGVADLAPFTTNIKGWLMKKQTAKSIVIDLNDDVAVIDIHVILKYGYKIPEVYEKIQAAVKEAVQNMTGIAVSKVNIQVAGIAFDEPKAEAAPIEAAEEE